jgi:(p)ppGpp synthase/HD superfamily hydrolase
MDGAEGGGGLGGAAGLRAQAMADRVLRTARASGTPADELVLLERAHALAMEPRLLAGVGSHDPDLLHPGRTALILLLDTGEARGEVLAAAVLAETLRRALRVPPARAREALGAEHGPRVAELLGEVPDPEDEALAERLLLASSEAQHVALAERLDHVRHAHLWPDLEARRAAHALTAAVYAGMAERVNPTLARRYARWCEMFERNRLR